MPPCTHTHTHTHLVCKLDPEQFEACMVLAGVGDAIGYKNGDWEFCPSGAVIHAELAALGGIKNIQVTPELWMVSDDTVMHIATAEALLSVPNFRNLDQLYIALAEHYKECMKQMAGRAPGLTCSSLIPMLKPRMPQGICLPFNPRGGGCGAAMRAAPIGLLFCWPEDISSLVAVSIESGRMSHNHPTGYLGSLATALFVSYAIQGKPLKEWGRGLLNTLEEQALKYIEKTGRDVYENQANWNYFKDQWMNYLKHRGIYDGQSEPNFPAEYGIVERDDFYYSLSFDGTGGASGHDAPMIAYDALLSCGDSWSELCSHSMLHGGDSDSTGIIAAACWGAMYGYKDVPEGNYQNMEFLEELQHLSKKLYERSHD